MLGMADDVFGSIRIPALCCGLYGFKPSSGRIPYGGIVKPGRDGDSGLLQVPGSIGKSVRDLTMIFRLLVRSEPWVKDALVLPIPWREVPGKDRLTIGLLLEDPSAPVAPSIMRALEDAEKKLVAAGHRIRMIISFPSLEKSEKLVWSYLNTDDSHTSRRQLHESGESTIPSITALQDSEPAARITMRRLYAMNAERAQFKIKWHKIFEEEKLDVLLMPAAPHTAPLHDTWTSTLYTSLWNLVDVSSHM